MSPTPESAPDTPQEPLGQLSRLGFALVGATSVDDIARSLLTDFAALPGVHRVGFALTEGGGRRLRFTASDREPGPDGAVDWCHIDAYDDVPLTHVVRTGETVAGATDALPARFESFASGQPDEVGAVAAVALPGVGSPIGGLVVFLERVWSDESQTRLLEATARRVADAVRRVRVVDAVDDEPEPGDESPLTARIVLDGEPRSAGVARRFLRDFLAGFEVSEELAGTAELCLSELVTNAIVHAGTRCELRATLDAVLTVSVSDRGQATDQLAPDPDLDPLRVHGRGLQLVEALADRWGSERDAAGTTMWFTLELDGAHAGADRTG